MCKKIVSNDTIVRENYFVNFYYHIFLCCSSVFTSVADSHLKLLDRTSHLVQFLLLNLDINFELGRLIGPLTLLYRHLLIVVIHCIQSCRHLFNKLDKLTRFAMNHSNWLFLAICFITTRFSRCLVLFTIISWNLLPDKVKNAENLQLFIRIE